MSEEVIVVFQGEPGAYSEAAGAELLGKKVIFKGMSSFNLCYEEVTERRAEFAMLPIENSVGGSIHANFDLQLRHSLYIVAELDFRVRHCLMALPGTKLEDIREAHSHPQALAQCEKYLRRRNLAAVVKYDTAGSAKQIREEMLQGVAAIASARAAVHYQLDILESGIEDDTNNYTRFLLLSRKPVTVPRSLTGDPTIDTPFKVSLVFSLVNSVGILFQALGAFSLRGLDFTKIESRPDTLHESGRFMGPLGAAFSDPNEDEDSFARSLPVPPPVPLSQDQQSFGMDRFRVMFFVDCLYVPEKLKYALHHLAEIAPYIRVLGCYPRNGVLLEHVAVAAGVNDGTVTSLDASSSSSSAAKLSLASTSSSISLKSISPAPGVVATNQTLRIGIAGFGNFGQFLAKRFVKYNLHVMATSRTDYSKIANEIGVQYVTDVGEMFQQSDIILLSMSILSFEDVLKSMPLELLKGKLVVDVLSVKEYPKKVLVQMLPIEADILCTHPMFGPESGKVSWKDLPFVYDRVRIADDVRCDAFINIFRRAGCSLVPMSCAAHDQAAANSQFITHFTGRMLTQLKLKPTGIDTKGFEKLRGLVENTVSDSDDLFKALYVHNPNSERELVRLQEAMNTVVNQLHDTKRNTSTYSSTNGNVAAGGIRFTKAINRVAPSKTVKTHSLAIELNRQGKDVMTTLTIGEPDYGPPQPVLDATIEAVRDPLGTKYTSVQGTIELRVAICDDLKKRKGVSYDPNKEICVSNGGKQSIYQAVQVLCEEGDEVIIPSPYWVSYPEIVLLCNATPVIVKRKASDGYLLDPEELRKAITPKTRMFIFCNPCNPTGVVHPRERLEAIAAVLRDFPHVFILCDEIYERLVFDGMEHVCFASLPGMKDRTLIVNGFSKGQAMTGFRLGYITGPAPIIANCIKLQGQLTSCPSSISQRAGHAALTKCTEEMLTPLYKGLEEKRDYLIGRLRAIPGVICPAASGAFYAFPVMTHFFGPGVTDPEGKPINDSTELCEYLIRLPKGIALVPGDAFGAPEGVRLCYAASMADLKEAADRIECGLSLIKKNKE